MALSGPLHRRCRTCGARPGHPCMGIFGAKTNPHFGR